MTLTSLKRFFIGRPFPTSAASHERLDKLRGLAVFASDPISSNAYATEAIMQVLLVLGSSALVMTMPIALAIALLVLLVIFSYTQTIAHYPQGGGAYIVAKDNLGTLPSLLAGAALLIDYVLTVSVSISAGIRALTSAFPVLLEWRLELALLTIVLLTLVNLRGVRESGTIFAFPTYAFVVGVLVVIVVGLVRYWGIWGAAPLPSHLEVMAPATTLNGIAYVWLLLRAFAAGCTALTGIEAISDGVAAFKAPEARNAAITMVIMGVMAMSLFLGISFLATHMHLIPHETQETILSQMTREVTTGVPGGRLLYFWVQGFTMLILILAANTGYQDFPRLGYFLARDGFLPRWLQYRGDRLVFSYGILVLAALASIIVVIFRAEEIPMLPLYALGVMVSFTLSQAGMVQLWNKIGRIPPGEELVTEATTLYAERGLWWKRALNAVGATVTLIVLLVLIATKFLDGAWAIVVALPFLILLFRTIKKHYRHVAERLRTRYLRADELLEIGDIVLVPLADVHRGTLRAIKYAKRISNHVRAVIILTDPAARVSVEERWARFPEITGGVELVFIEYEYRNILAPLVDYITRVNKVEYPHQLITVVIPEFVPESMPAHLLHNQTANLLRWHLHGQPDVVVIDVPYHL
jgi:amino acid transporter